MNLPQKLSKRLHLVNLQLKISWHGYYGNHLDQDYLDNSLNTFNLNCCIGIDTLILIVCALMLICLFCISKSFFIFFIFQNNLNRYLIYLLNIRHRPWIHIYITYIILTEFIKIFILARVNMLPKILLLLL